MTQPNYESSLWFSLFFILSLGFIMLYGTFKRVFDEAGALYEIEYRSSSPKTLVITRLGSTSVILYLLFLFSQGKFNSNDNSLLVLLSALFVLTYFQSYSREENFSSLFFKNDLLLIGYRKYNYEDIEIISDSLKVKIMRISNKEIICTFPKKYLNESDFVNFIEENGFQTKLSYMDRKVDK